MQEYFFEKTLVILISILERFIHFSNNLLFNMGRTFSIVETVYSSEKVVGSKAFLVISL